MEMFHDYTVGQVSVVDAINKNLIYIHQSTYLRNIQTRHKPFKYLQLHFIYGCIYYINRSCNFYFEREHFSHVLSELNQ